MFNYDERTKGKQKYGWLICRGSKFYNQITLLEKLLPTVRLLFLWKVRYGVGDFGRKTNGLSTCYDCPCYGKKGARILMPSCSFKFEIERFLNELPPEVPPPLLSGKDDRTAPSVIIIVVPTVTAIGLLIVCISVILIKKKRKKKPVHEDDNDTISAESLRYQFSTIGAATENFSDENKLGQGGFGPVYTALTQWLYEADLCVGGVAFLLRLEFIGMVGFNILSYAQKVKESKH